MKKLIPLCFGLLCVLAAVTAAFGQAPAPAGAKPVPLDANTQQYNNAINLFNQATQEYNAAKSNHTSPDKANADIAADLTQLQAVAQLAPYKNDPTVHNLLGYLYLTQGSPDSVQKAIPELQTTVQLKPDNLDARNNLGNALRDADPPRYDDAAVQYQYILAHPPAPGDKSSLDLNKVKFNLATVLGQQGRLDESLAQFADLTTSHPDAAAWKNYGFFLQKAGKTAEAANALHQSAELNPSDANARLDAGELYAKAGSPAEAIPDLTKAVGPDLAPQLDNISKYNAYFALGEMQAAQGSTNEAIKAFAAAAPLQPQTAAPLYNEGALQEQAGLKSDAAASYRSALAIDPGNAQIQTALGLLLADGSNPPEAISLLSQAAPKMPQDAPADRVKAAIVYARLAELYGKQKNYASANQARLQALALNPDDTTLRLMLADSYLAQKQYVSALVQYDLAAKAQPKDAVIQNQRGVAYKNLGQYPKSLAAFKSAVALDPTNARAQNNIGVLYELLGQPAQAIVAYKKALALNPKLAEAKQNLLNLSHYTSQ